MPHQARQNGREGPRRGGWFPAPQNASTGPLARFDGLTCLRGAVSPGTLTTVDAALPYRTDQQVVRGAFQEAQQGLVLRILVRLTIRNAMGYTLGTAAKATGMSRTAVLRAIQSHKISAKKNEHGEWDIDPAELHRVYPPKQGAPVADTGQVNDTQQPSNTDLMLENREMKARLQAAEQRIRDKDGTIDDLRRRLDAEAEERRKLTALLTDQREKAQESPPAPPRRSWWPWGRG